MVLVDDLHTCRGRCLRQRTTITSIRSCFSKLHVVNFAQLHQSSNLTADVPTCSATTTSSALETHLIVTTSQVTSLSNLTHWLEMHEVLIFVMLCKLYSLTHCDCIHT